jgi:hypothetical protein
MSGDAAATQMSTNQTEMLNMSTGRAGEMRHPRACPMPRTDLGVCNRARSMPRPAEAFARFNMILAFSGVEIRLSCTLASNHNNICYQAQPRCLRGVVLSAST